MPVNPPRRCESRDIEGPSPSVFGVLSLLMCSEREPVHAMYFWNAIRSKVLPSRMRLGLHIETDTQTYTDTYRTHLRKGENGQEIEKFGVAVSSSFL